MEKEESKEKENYAEDPSLRRGKVCYTIYDFCAFMNELMVKVPKGLFWVVYFSLTEMSRFTIL